ncbi:MAG: hypothetical protein ACXWAC_13225 [Usitatibacter sp.]
MAEVESVSGGTEINPFDISTWTGAYLDAVDFAASIMCTVTGKCTA